MNAERLLQHYERIAGAPDAIARLRRFVLDLAVRGKLVPQDPNDEPASELLERIACEKARLVKTGTIRKDKPLQAIGDSVEFDIPGTWQWVRLGSITTYIQRGKSPKYATSDGSPVVSQKCVQWRGLDLSVAKLITVESLADYEDIRFIRDGDLLWNSTGTGTIGRVIRVVDPPENLVCDSHVTVVRCLEVAPEYIRTWLRSDQVYGVIEDRAAGSTNQVELTAQMALNQVVPLPPLAEQHRIVAKVDELMGLCDRLAAAREAQEATRARLAAASLARLNTPDPDTFKDDARFALDALPALTTRPDQIKRLRQTILNLAVRGKLVPQDPSDEPASELLKRIAKEKAGSKKSEAGGVCNSPSEIDGFDAQLNLPIGWAWATLGAITHIGTGLTPSKARSDYYEGGNIPWINSSATSEDVIQEARFFVTQKAVKECRLKIFPAGSLVVALYGQGKTRGQVAELGLDATVNQACAVVQWLPSFQEIKGFVSLTLAQQYDAMRERAEGGPQPNLNVGKIKDRHFPLPPLAEQHRIVAKVDALMTQCDRLEASLDQTAATRRRLLDALLAEALAPVDAREMAAAE